MSMKWLLLIFGAFLAWVAYKTLVFHPADLPPYTLDNWWGPLPKTKDTAIKPFQVAFKDEMVQDLKHRLKTRRKFTPPLDGIHFQYGFNSDTLEGILDFWQNSYNFTEREKFFNKYPQFRTNIQGLNMHYIHVKPAVQNKVKVLPLLLLHGWPGSVKEFYEVIPLLTTPRAGYDFVFEVIAPSLPGYGWSDAAVRPGFSPMEVAIVLRNLMHRTGHSKFYVQGGDWGSILGSIMATLFQDEVLGYHTNMPMATNKGVLKNMILGSLLPFLVEPRIASRIYPLSNLFSMFMEETGYYHIQATKPDTIGIGLSDSPAGLAAYILEKFSTGTNLEFRALQGGGLSNWRTEDLLDNVMVYWANNAGTTAARLYSEMMTEGFQGVFQQIDCVPTTVPTWGLHTANEPLFLPITMMRSKYKNLIDASFISEGGHFAAMEIPKLFAEDVFRAGRAFVEFHKRGVKNEL